MQAGLDESGTSETPVDRAELERRLGEVDQSLADMYRYAVLLLLGSERNLAVSSLISHSVREISNSLPRHLGLAEDVQIPPRSDESAPLKRLAELFADGDPWAQPAAMEPDGSGLNTSQSGVDQTIELRQAVEDLVTAHTKATQNAAQSRAFVAAWELSASKSPTAIMFGSVFDFFMRYAHLGAPKLPSEPLLQSNFVRFEVIVRARLGDFFDTRGELDEILDAANAITVEADDAAAAVESAKDGVSPQPVFSVPEAALVDRAVERLGHAQHRFYFYSKLVNPLWVAPLTRKRAFQLTPTVDAQGATRGGSWPEGEYLARVAPYVPQEVLSALRPALSSDHPVVQKIVLQVATCMPADAIVELLQTIYRHLQSRWGTLLDPVKLVGLIRRLSEAERAKKARELANRLYTPRPSTDPTADPSTELESYWYVQTLPEAVAALGVELRTLTTVIGWLETWVKLAPLSATLMAMSHRPLEQSGHMRATEPIAYALVDTVRSLARELIATDVPLVLINQRLEAPRVEPNASTLFKCLAMDATATALEIEDATAAGSHQAGVEAPGDSSALSIAASYLMAPELLRGSYLPEYRVLARAALPRLAAAECEQWKALIMNPPHLTREYVERALRGFAKDPATVTEKQFSAYRDVWQRDLLAAIGRDVLPSNLSTWLDELVDRHGEAVASAMESAIDGILVGPTSPLSDEEGLGKTPDDLVAFAKTWEPGPETDWTAGFPPTREGLARTISHAVSANPGLYARHAELFIGLHRSYISAFFEGLHQSIAQKRDFTWDQVLVLAAHAAGQPDSGQDDESEQQLWLPVQFQVARLLQAGVEAADESAIPVSLHTKTWRALEPLVHSPDPASDQGEIGVQQQMDPMTLSVNTVRPAALRTTIRLLAAVARRPADPDQHDSEVQSATQAGLSEQILDVLDAHAGPLQDESLAVAVVFGEGIGLLLTAADPWTREHLQRLLGDPDDRSKNTETQRAWFAAAWGMVVTAYAPSRALFDALGPWFTAHIEHLDAAQPAGSGELNPRAVTLAVANHVLLLYVLGQLDEDLRNPTLNSLFTCADGALLRQALGDLGWRLHRAQGDVDDAVLERLRALWDWRAEQVTSGHADQQELLDFYWWVASERLEPAWWLPHLATISESPDFNPHEMIGAPLAIAAQVDPAQALTIFTRLYNTSRRTTPSADLAQHAPAILKAALAAEPAIQAPARDLINQMGRDGYTDLMDRIHALPD